DLSDQRREGRNKPARLLVAPLLGERGVAAHVGDEEGPDRAGGGGGHRTGISAITRVPAPVVLSTRSRPPSAATRSASPVSPDPEAGSAPPTPSSATSTSRLSSSSVASTVTDEAFACRAALVRASETTK